VLFGPPDTPVGERAAVLEVPIGTPPALFETRDRDLDLGTGRYQHADVGGAVLSAADELLPFNDEDGGIGGVDDDKLGNLCGGKFVDDQARIGPGSYFGQMVAWEIDGEQ